MSRTDKDRPYWVKTLQDGYIIDHDHRKGECIEETLETQKFYTGGASWRAHRSGHTCNKNMYIEFYCTRQKVNGKKQNVYDYESASRWVRNIGNRGCWTRTCDCGHGDYEYLERTYCDKKYYVACEGHYVYERHPENECVCDTWPNVPTCDMEPIDSTQSRYCYGGVPSWYITNMYHRPERSRERKLKDYVREYNAYGELEDGDFVNRQARNSARWMWW